MKKMLLIVCVLAMLCTLCLPAFAEQESYELLENGDFEQFSTVWTKYYMASVDYCDAAHTGNGAFSITGRQHSTDIARQDITEPLEYYGPGQYELSAWLRLADPAAEPIAVQIAIGVYLKNGQKFWFTTPGFVTITAEWTQIKGQTNISWSGEIDEAEFYLVSPMNGQEDTSKDFRDLYLDDCSMKALSYSGAPYVPETQPPVTTEPNTTEPDTTEPDTTPAPDDTTQAGTTAPEQPDGTEQEPESEIPTDPTDEQGKGRISAQTWVIAGTMGAVALILLATGVALSISFARGKKNEAGK